MNRKNRIRDDYYNDNYVDDNQYEEYSEYEQDTDEEYDDTDYSEEEYNYEQQHDKPVEHHRYQRTSQPAKKRSKRSFKRVLGGIIAGFAAIMVFVFAVSWVMSLFLPSTTNFLIMATDEDGTRTDTLMLGSFDKSSKGITLVSIPRDTYVTVSDESYAVMNKDYPQPGSKNMKINAVHHYAGKKHGTELILNEVKNLLGIDIDFYVKVDFEAFRYIIDSVGGIDFYVPQDMSYSDPLQNLYIDLKEGQQHLNGAQAEQVLRYRSGYANADIGRVSVQQDFMKEFISQAFSKTNLISHPGAFVNAIFKYGYIETNAGIFDMISYAMSLGGVNIDNIETHTLPGTPAMRGGQSVYLLNEAETQKIISAINGD